MGEKSEFLRYAVVVLPSFGDLLNTDVLISIRSVLFSSACSEVFSSMCCYVKYVAL